MQRRHLLALAGIAALFLIVRLLLVWRFPPFYDEVLYADWAYHGAADPAQRFVSMAIGRAPLFSWAGMVAVAAGLAPITAVRVVSLLSGLATFAISGLLGRELGGPRVGLTACALVAITPFLMVHDVIGIYDPLVTALVTAALYLQIRLAQRQGLADALLLGIALGCGALAKESAYIALALLPFGLLVFDWSPARRAERLARWVGGIALALLITWALYSLMKLSPLWNTYREQLRIQAGGAAAGYPTHTLTEGLKHPWRYLSSNWPGFGSDTWQYVTPTILLAAVIGFVHGVRRNWRLTALLAIAFAASYAAALIVTNEQVPRYLLTGIPPLLVLAAAGAVAAFDWLRASGRPAGRRRAIVAVAALLFVLPAAIFDGRVLAAPATARYPGFDDVQYVTGGAALEPYKRLDRDLDAVIQGRNVTIALGDFTSNWFDVAFRNDHNVTFVRATAPPLCTSLYAIETQVPLPARTDGLAWKPVRVYTRPRHGVPTTLYESVVPYHGRVAATPDELRSLIGGSDADYDAFGKAHPCVQAWEQAWYTLHPS